MPARKQRNVAAEIRIGRPKPCKPRKTAGKPRASHDQRKNAVAPATAMIPSTPMVRGKAVEVLDDENAGAEQRVMARLGRAASLVGRTEVKADEAEFRLDDPLRRGHSEVGRLPVVPRGSPES